MHGLERALTDRPGQRVARMADQWSHQVYATRRAAPEIRLRDVFAAPDQLCGLDDDRSACDCEHHGDPGAGANRRANQRRVAVERHRGAQRAQRRGDERQPHQRERVVRLAQRHRHASDLPRRAAGHRNPHRQYKGQHRQRYQAADCCTKRTSSGQAFVTRQRDRVRGSQCVSRRKECDVHDVVVRGIGRGGEDKSGGNGSRRRSALHRQMKGQREERQHPAGHQIEVPEQMR